MVESDDLAPSPNGFVLPPGSGQYRRPVVAAPGCYIYFDRQQPAIWPRHQHRQLQITVISAGADCVAIWRTRDGRQHRYRIADKGDQVLIIPAGQKHAIEWHKESEVLSLYVELAWARRIVSRRIAHISIEPLDTYIETAPIIGEITAIFRRECARPVDSMNETMIETLGPALAAQLLQAHFAPYHRKDPLRWTLPGPVLDRLLSHIAKNLDQDLSLSVLAGMANLSPSYFGQLFRGATGQAPHLYVTQKRVMRAKELLGTGNYRVAEVSDLVGFAEPHRMNYHFRRLLNTYPSAYIPQECAEIKRL
jgi:AraC family transcriptional regulator